MKTSSLNILIVLVGVFITCIGLFRAHPVRVDNKFLWANGPMIVALLISIAISLRIRSLTAGIDMTVMTAGSFMPLLILLIPVIGLSTPIAAHYGPSLSKLLSGRFGYPVALGASVVSPSGNAFAGLIKGLWSNKELRPLLLYFTTVTPLTSISIFYIRKLGVGEEIATEMYRASLFSALALLPCFWVWEKFFCR